MSHEVHRIFFHDFLDFESTVLFQKFVVNLRKSPEAWDRAASDFTLAAMPGCIGSMDATHVEAQGIPYQLRQMHLGFKSSVPARSFNVTVNHRREIVHSTEGFPTRWNDKTIVRYDAVANGLRDGTLAQDRHFKLLERRNGEVVEVCYQGAWLVVDNSYLNWSSTVPPMKHPVHRKDLMWLEWVESMRKDVECTFGILKGRFRIFQSPI